MLKFKLKITLTQAQQTQKRELLFRSLRCPMKTIFPYLHNRAATGATTSALG